MTREEVVAKEQREYQELESKDLEQSLGDAYDQGFADGKADVAPEKEDAPKEDAPKEEAKDPDVKFKQSDIDEAVASAKAADAQALSDAQMKATSNLAAVSAQLDLISRKEKVESGQIAGLKVAMDQARAAMEALTELIPDAPAASEDDETKVSLSKPGEMPSTGSDEVGQASTDPAINNAVTQTPPGSEVVKPIVGGVVADDGAGESAHDAKPVDAPEMDEAPVDGLVDKGEEAPGVGEASSAQKAAAKDPADVAVNTATFTIGAK